MKTGAHTVLVVEDFDAVRHLICTMLARHGFTALEASNGVQGLAMFNRVNGQVDLAIVDMVMPGMNGLDLAAELERQHPRLKILYISACVGSIAMESMLRCSPENVLLKPFTEHHLIDRVSRILGVRSDAPRQDETAESAEQ
jgi:CheY-like chemotaxis protein